MIVYKLEQDGGFIAGDTATRRAAYAYPTSEHANIARKMPERVAAEMIASSDRFHGSLCQSDTFYLNNVLDFYSRLWARLSRETN